MRSPTGAASRALAAAWLASALAAGPAGCGSETIQKPAAEALTVATAAVALRPVARVVSASGTVHAWQELPIGAETSGAAVVELFVEEGDTVERGQPLAQLNDRVLRAQLAQQEASVAEARATVVEAKATLDRAEEMRRKDATSAQNLDARRAASATAGARLAVAEAARAETAARLGQLRITAPADGYVSSRTIEIGQVVAAGQPVLRVARPEEKEVLVAVPESRLAEVRAAPYFNVQLWVAPQEQMRGELRELASVADPQTRTYAARIRLLAPPPSVSLGMTARVTPANEASAGVLVPLAAVGDRGEGSFVWVEKDGKLSARPVKVTAFRADGALLGAGLAAGENVVIAGINLLSEGLAVSARPAPPPAAQR